MILQLRTPWFWHWAMAVFCAAAWPAFIAQPTPTWPVPPASAPSRPPAMAAHCGTGAGGTGAAGGVAGAAGATGFTEAISGAQAMAHLPVAQRSQIVLAGLLA